MVAYWVYCCPTALKYYLYQASPDLYQALPEQRILKTLINKSYRNLYFCLPLTTALVAISISLPLLFIWKGWSIHWVHWLLGLAIGNVIGIIFLVTFGLTFNLVSNTARGAAAGSIISLISGVANATVLSILLGGSQGWSYAELFTASNLHSIFAFFSLAIGTPVALMLGGLIGGLIGTATGILSGLVASVVFSVIRTIADPVSSGLVYAVAIGLATSGTAGASMTMSSALVFCLAVGIAVGVSIFLIHKIFLYALICTILVWLGVIRFLPLHISYIIYILISRLRLGTYIYHPIAWDELIILPLPGTQQYIEKLLITNPIQGLSLINQIIKNPFQRPLIQRVLKAYIHNHDQPLETLYRILEFQQANEYIFSPVDAYDWNNLISNRTALLSELSSHWVDCTSEMTSYRIERFFYSLTWLRRNHQKTPITDFCIMLNEVISRKSVNESNFKLSHHASSFSNLSIYPKGTEVGFLMSLISQFLECKRLEDIVELTKSDLEISIEHQSIRPDTSKVLVALSDIAEDISQSLNLNSLYAKQAVLLRANSNLDNLDKLPNLENEILEYNLLYKIIQQWKHLITKAGGEAGNDDRSVFLLSNPYIIGTPVTGNSFFGREDILQRLTDELFLLPGQCPSIILYGHRRMGKSSIIKSLRLRLKETHIKVVDFNMQILGQVSNTGELLYALACQIYRSYFDSSDEFLDNPQREEFICSNPYHALNTFFQQLELVRNDLRFVIAIDEFENIEHKIDRQDLNENLLEFLRGLTQTYPWFSLIFAGLHTIEEMSYSYWHPFFTSIPIHVDFLNPTAAKRLIMQAEQVIYDDQVVDTILTLTNGQPYLIQLIGHALISYLNRRYLENRFRFTRKPILTSNDLETVLNSSEFYTIGSAYFKGIWLQAKQREPLGQIQILTNLALRTLSSEELVQATELTSEQIDAALRVLQRHDVIYQDGDKFMYTVELMRRWVVQKTNNDF